MKDIYLFPYYGGKHQWLDFLLPLFPTGPTHLVDVFGGGGAVTLNCVRYPYATYNDVDERLFCFFRVLRDNPDELIRAISLSPHSRADWNIASRWAEWGDCEDVEKARRVFVALNQGFNGVMLKTGHNFWRRKPSGMSAQSGAAKLSALERAAENLSRVTLECLPWQDMIRDYNKPRVVMYLDPPYLLETRKSKNMYEHEFSDQDHEDLLAALSKLTCMALLSGYNNDMYNEALSGWHRVDSPARPTAAAKNGTRVESVWMNFEPESRPLAVAQ